MLDKDYMSQWYWEPDFLDLLEILIEYMPNRSNELYFTTIQEALSNVWEYKNLQKIQ